MDPVTFSQHREYLRSLPEDKLRRLLVEFFIVSRGVRAAVVHGTGEHGVDVLAYVDPTKDFLHKGYNVLIQAKRGNVTLSRWRNEVLGPLYEATYYPVSHHYYAENHARRVWLVLTGSLTPEASNSIRVFNACHDVTIEVLELDELIQLFDEFGFVDAILVRIGEMGSEMESGERALAPPVMGEDSAQGFTGGET